MYLNVSETPIYLCVTPSSMSMQTADWQKLQHLHTKQKHTSIKVKLFFKLNSCFSRMFEQLKGKKAFK